MHVAGGEVDELQVENLLALAVLVDDEIRGAQVADKVAVAVVDDDVDAHARHSGGEHLRLLVLRGAHRVFEGTVTAALAAALWKLAAG